MKLSTIIWTWIWKRKLWLLLGGVLMCALLIFCTSRDNSYQMRISYVYPGAESGLYPDGQRLLRDDLIATERIEEALEAMREKGWYTDMTAKQIRDHLSVQEYLSNPVQEKVEALRAEGKEYTYYNNEFIITFTQPTVLHLKSASDFFGLTRPDRSKEFVEQLLRAVTSAFIREHTEGKVFADFSEYMEVGEADYHVVVSLYTEKVNLCINYLNKKKAADSTFVSATTNLSFDDLITSYQSLIDVQIARLLKYYSSEKVTKSLQERVNGYKVQIENLRLNQKKNQDEHDIAQTAMLEYDHTFSENIIIVSVNEENGLYQARPKTAYDTVTQQALDAGVTASVNGNTASDDERLIQEYSASMSVGPEEKIATADEMKQAIYDEYERISALCASTIVDYIDKTNCNYIQTAAVSSDGFSLTRIIKWGAYFAFGVGLTALACYLLERRRQKRAEVREGGKA